MTAATTGGDGLEIDVRHDGGESTIVLPGELDLGSAPHLRYALQECLATSPRSLSVDVDGLTYADSVGLSLLVTGYRRADAEGFSFTLTRPSPQLRRILEVSGLQELLDGDPGHDSTGFDSTGLDG